MRSCRGERVREGARGEPGGAAATVMQGARAQIPLAAGREAEDPIAVAAKSHGTIIFSPWAYPVQRAPTLYGVWGRVSVASLTLACAMRGDRDSNPGPSGHNYFFSMTVFFPPLDALSLQLAVLFPVLPRTRTRSALLQIFPALAFY